MAFEYAPSRLQDHEFVFYFSGGAGVRADRLGDLLRRAATVAGRVGAELQITALEPGSLSVVVRTMKKSGAAVGNEFKASPIQTTGAAAMLAGLVVSTLVQAMSPESGEAKPIAKVAAEMVEKGDAEQIEIITRTSTVLVMNAERARFIRENDRRRKRSRLLDTSTVDALIESAHKGTLTGTVVDVDGELHFRPDGFRYLVPIDMQRSEAAQALFSGLHYRVNADLTTYHGQPDNILIYRAAPGQRQQLRVKPVIRECYTRSGELKRPASSEFPDRRHVIFNAIEDRAQDAPRGEPRIIPVPGFPNDGDLSP